MVKWLITGAAGFVGRHFINALRSESSNDGVEIIGVDQRTNVQTETDASTRFMVVDLTDREAVERLLLEFKPRYIVHLAAMSSVAASWVDPPGAILNNVALFLNLLEAVRRVQEHFPDQLCRILVVGSSEVYASASEPLDESAPLLPASPYAVGRLTQEHLVRLYVNHFDLDIVATRSFVHIGPGQDERFAIASFVRQLVQAKREGQTRTTLETGNVDLVRDISDVRDTVRAYRLLLERGRRGEIYNVCRSQAISLRKVIENIASQLNLETTILIDPKRLRPTDPAIVLGSNTKIHRETGWMPTTPREQTLRDMISSVAQPASQGR